MSLLAQCVTRRSLQHAVTVMEAATVLLLQAGSGGGCPHHSQQQLPLAALRLLRQPARWRHSASCASSESSAQQAGTADAGSSRTPSFEEQEASCWSCHNRHHRGGLVCQACDKIQPIDPTLTYFDIMGYHAPTFDLDPGALEKRYKLLQWTLHPDRSAGKPPEEQAYSAAQAALVNQAYGVLRQPLARANYMLLLAGVLGQQHEEGTIADPELLMEVMEAREEVEDTDDQEALVRLHSTNRARQAELCTQLSAALGSQEWECARQLVAQLSYWVRLEEAIAAKL